MDVHRLLAGRLERGAGVIGVNRKLTPPAVDEHEELDGLRSPEVDERRDRGAYRSPGVEHVVDEHDPGVIHVKRELGAAENGLLTHGRQVITVQRDVEHSQFGAPAGSSFDELREPLGKRHPPRPNSDESDATRETAGLLGNLSRKPLERLLERRSVHDLGFRHRSGFYQLPPPGPPPTPLPLPLPLPVRVTDSLDLAKVVVDTDRS